MERNRTRQQMAALVRQWEMSGEPRRAFARRHGLTVSQFDYWKRQVRRHDPEKTEEPVGFARVHVIGGAVGGQGGAGIEVELRGGERLAIHERTSPDLVRAVVVALRSSC